MEHVLKTTLLGLFFGTFGTTIGGVLGLLLKTNTNKFLSFILSLASGLMTSIVCFELIPEALEISGIFTVLCGILFGILMMFFCDLIVASKFNNKVCSNQKQSLLKTGIIVSIGLAIHNFPEGLAIGSGFEASLTLGYSLAIAIAFHDVPEGISMSIPLKHGGLSSIRVIWYVILSGVTTGIGALFGCLIGGISDKIISLCLAFAAGAMLYIISGELTPESNKLDNGKSPMIGNLIGVIVGLIALQFN